MTEKRFDVIHSPVTGLFVVTDDEHKEVFEGIKSYGNACRFANLLNALHEENQRLKSRLQDKDKLLQKELTVNSNLNKRIKELEDDTE